MGLKNEWRERIGKCWKRLQTCALWPVERSGDSDISHQRSEPAGTSHQWPLRIWIPRMYRKVAAMLEPKAMAAAGKIHSLGLQFYRYGATSWCALLTSILTQADSASKLPGAARVTHLYWTQSLVILRVQIFQLYIPVLVCYKSCQI